MSKPTRDGKDGPAAESVNRARAALYERLMESQERIAHARYGRGISHDTIVAALDVAEERLTDDEQREDLYLSSLRHFVSELGGRLEVRVVFDDEVVLVRSLG